MNRRDFVVASGTGFLTGGLGLSQTNRPAVGVEFKINTPNRKPNNVDNLLIDIDKLEITPSHLDESENMSVQAELDVDNYQLESSDKLNISVTNGRTEKLSKKIDPLLVEGIDTESSIYGTITVNVVHPDIRDAYTQRFNITSNDVPSIVVDRFEDGNINEYSVSANGSYSLDTTTNTVQEGNYATAFQQSSSVKVFSEQSDGLNYYPQQGDVVEWYVYHDYIETSTTGIVFGSNGDPYNWAEGYELNVRANGNNSGFEMSLSSRGGGESSSVSIGNYLNEWLRGRFEWSSNNNLQYELYQTNGSRDRSDHTPIKSVSYDATGEDALSNRACGFYANNFGSGGRQSRAIYDDIRAEKNSV
jgi:hypothetical protein